MSYGGYPPGSNQQPAAAPGYPPQQPPPPINYQPSTAYPTPPPGQQQPPQQYPPQPPGQSQYPPQQQPGQQPYPPQQQPPGQQPYPPQQQPPGQQPYPPQQQTQYPPQQGYQPPPPGQPAYQPQPQQPPPGQPAYQQYPPPQQPPYQQPPVAGQPNVVVNTLVGILEVRVLEAEYPKRGLWRGMGNDPYVKVSLGSNHHRTKIFKGATKATHASWYETFDFPNMNGPVSLTIELMDDDNITPDSLIGTCTVPVSMDKFPSNLPEWYPLTKRDRSTPAGRIQLSLRMKPPTVVLPAAGIYTPGAVAYGGTVASVTTYTQQPAYAAPYGAPAAGYAVRPAYPAPQVQVYQPGYPPPQVQVYQPGYPPPQVQVYQPGYPPPQVQVYQQPGVVYQQPPAPGYVYYR